MLSCSHLCASSLFLYHDLSLVLSLSLPLYLSMGPSSLIKLTVWQKGFWLGDKDTSDDGEEQVDTPLLIEGVGILSSLESVVPDGRSIFADDELPVSVSPGPVGAHSFIHQTGRLVNA